ncbi:MAG: hypothetical protein K2M11_07985 [Paramuribaculum sp.]|nr:hypothetical protein [Paramuribaculum sp.]
MQHKFVRLQSLVAVALCVIIGMVFNSCSDDGDEPEKEVYEANAEGVVINLSGDGKFKTEYYHFWINSESINAMSEDLRELNIPPSQYGVVAPYYPLSMELVYASLTDFYGKKIDENTDLSKLVPNPTDYINYIKHIKSEYRYAANLYGTLIMFNRTAEINY